MSYVLSVIHPPVAPAAYGKAVVLEPAPTKEALQSRVEYVLVSEAAMDKGIAMAHGLTVLSGDPGWETTTGSGFILRYDDADSAPHPCPCCGRLVLPTDHADAGMEDAYCLGCFTWSRDNIQCLPANTAHTEEP